jgi:hypothetical protein
MAYVTPGTVAAGDVATAAAWNVVVANEVDLRSYQNRYARFKRTAGDLSLNSTVWSDLPTISTSGDLTINATTGDVVVVAACGLWSTENVDANLDVVTIVAGSVVNSFGADGTPSNSHSGIRSWSALGPAYWTIGGNFYRTLVSGDISSGTVTLRVRYRTGIASNKTLFGSTNNPFEYFAQNLGPVTT